MNTMVFILALAGIVSTSLSIFAAKTYCARLEYKKSLHSCINWQVIQLNPCRINTTDSWHGTHYQRDETNLLMRCKDCGNVKSKTVGGYFTTWKTSSPTGQ